METGCYSLHRLKHRAVITLIIVFSLLFYIFCIHIHYYNRTLETIGILRNVDQQLQQNVLYDLFTGKIDIEDGKYVLMKNGYQFSGQYFLFVDPYIIGINVIYLIIMIYIFYIYKKYIKNATKRAEKELNYMKREMEHFLFGSPIMREDSYKECNYLLDRLEQRVCDMSLLNKNELDRILNLHQNIIHQINTPLNTIKILIEYLYNENKIEKIILDEMDYAIKKASDLTRIYLRLSKFDTGKVKYRFERIELYDMVEEVISSLQIYADYYHIFLINKCGNSIIYADAVWIKEAIENIVKNCIENVGDSNKILVSSRSFNDNTTIYIDAIEEESIDVECISFERFESSQTGIGIGLHLCKQIIETHLGEISVEQSELGGLRFIIKLPKMAHKEKIKLEDEYENNFKGT